MFSKSKIGFEFAKSTPIASSYFVCSTPRCGSSLVCESLFNTGLAGAPTEYFDAAIEERFCRHWSITNFEDYLLKLTQTRTGPNGVFGTKVHFNQFNRCFGVESLPTHFPNPKFIWLKREDLVAQAVSYAIAIQTEKWSDSLPGNGREPVFDQNQISLLRNRIQREQSKWADFFSQHAIEPLELSYEVTANQLLATTRRCLEFMGIQFPSDLSVEPITLVKQADGSSQEWIERFRKNDSSN